MRLRTDAEHTLRPAADLVAAYMSGKNWSASYRAAVERLVARHVAPHIADLRCGELTLGTFQEILDSASSRTTAVRLSSVVTGFIAAGLALGHLSDPDLAVVVWRGRVTQPALAGPAPQFGLARATVGAAAIPGHGDVARLGAAVAEGRAWYWELAAHLAAYSGLRFGELAALRSDRVDILGRRIDVAVQASEFRGRVRVGPPKGSKTRVTIYPRITPTGYPLGAMLKRRLEEIRQIEGPELSAPLVFPAVRGGFVRASNFSRQVLRPGYAEAGWREPGNCGWTWHSLRHVFCTTALNEWGLPLTDVSTLAGHTRTALTADMYISPMAGVLARAHRATAVTT